MKPSKRQNFDFGAEAMARRGKDYEDILQYYYPGSKIESIYRHSGD